MAKRKLATKKRQPIKRSKKQPLPAVRQKPAPLPDRLESLTEAQRHFVLEYLANGYNATAAYVAAHPTVLRTTAATEGYRLLKNPEIAELIAREERKRWTRLQLSGDEALGMISLVARADIADAYDEHGSLLPVHQWPKNLRLCVKRVKDDEVTLYDALRARELMAQVHGRLKPEGTLAASLSTLAQLLTGQYDPEEDRD